MPRITEQKLICSDGQNKTEELIIIANHYYLLILMRFCGVVVAVKKL